MTDGSTRSLHHASSHALPSQSVTSSLLSVLVDSNSVLADLSMIDFTMQRVISILIFAIAATTVLGAPFAPVKTRAKGHFKVVGKGRTKLVPAEEFAHAYRKHGWEIIIWNQGQDSEGFGSQSSSAAPSASSTSPPRAGSSTAPFASGNTTKSPSPGTTGSPTAGAEEGEVTATGERNDAEYISPITIGGQTLNLNLDTGSSDLWVFSSELLASEQVGHTVFDPSKSSSFSIYQGGSWQIQYGDGSQAEGSVGFDTVNVGGAVVEKQCIELAKQISSTFVQDPFSDGLMGLGFSSINQVQPQQQKTFFDNVMDQLDQPVFTADLAETGASIYEFGTIDQSKFTGDLHYTPVDPTNGYWQFDSPSNTIGGSQRACGLCSPAIADTGTSLIIADDDVVDAYYRQVEGAKISTTAGGAVYPCSATLPDFGVAIGEGFTAIVKGADMTFAELDGPDAGLCYGGVQANGASTRQGIPLQIYGDVLLKHFFVVFDGGNTTLGIAPKA